MNATTKFRGHLCALFCVIVWGITFIVSAKLLVVCILYTYPSPRDRD